MRITSTRLTALKRPFKKIQNLFKDPLPRNRELVFEGYKLNLPEIVYQFSVAGKKYLSTASIDLPAEDLAQLNREDHHPLFVNLGLALVSGHFLLSDFSTVRVDCAKLDSRQIQLLEKHLKKEESSLWMKLMPETLTYLSLLTQLLLTDSVHSQTV